MAQQQFAEAVNGNKQIVASAFTVRWRSSSLLKRYEQKKEGGGGDLGVYGPRVVTKTIAVRFFSSGPSKEPLPLLESLFMTCPGKTGLYAYSWIF